MQWWLNVAFKLFFLSFIYLNFGKFSFAYLLNNCVIYIKTQSDRKQMGKRKSYSGITKLTYELNTPIDKIAGFFGISKMMFWMAVNTYNTTFSFENPSQPSDKVCKVWF